MYGRDVVSVSVVELTKVRVKALEGGFDIDSFSLFIFFSFGSIARPGCAGRRFHERDFVG